MQKEKMIGCPRCMGRTCGEPNEIKKITTRKYISDLFVRSPPALPPAPSAPVLDAPRSHEVARRGDIDDAGASPGAPMGTGAPSQFPVELG